MTLLTLDGKEGKSFKRVFEKAEPVIMEWLFGLLIFICGIIVGACGVNILFGK